MHKMTLVNYYFNRTRKQPACKGAITSQAVLAC